LIVHLECGAHQLITFVFEHVHDSRQKEGREPRLFGPAIAASILSCMAGDNK
jgi:hypothetical protein